MANCDKLLQKAKYSANNLSFQEICDLAKCYGWIFRRQTGSHRMYANPKLASHQGRVQNFQDLKGKAKPYQVKQLLKAIELLPNANYIRHSYFLEQ